MKVASEPKYRDVVRESIVEGPPGIHGVILEIDLAKAKEENANTTDCLKFYSLRAV